MTDSGLRPLVPATGVGRHFTGSQRVRPAHADADGLLRLDALLRATQEISDDDTTDAGLDTDPVWVARRSVVDVIGSAAVGEHLVLDTFCGGIGPRWAERRLSIRGEGGARYEVSTLWICIDRTSGRPVAVTDQFRDLYGPAAGGRRVGARLELPIPAGVPPDRAPTVHDGTSGAARWSLRAVDYDLNGHVNNAAYAAAVEELAVRWRPRAPYRWEIEYRSGITPRPAVTLRWERRADRDLLWWLVDGDRPDAGPEVAATSAFTPLPVELYREVAPDASASAAG